MEMHNLQRQKKTMVRPLKRQVTRRGTMSASWPRSTGYGNAGGIWYTPGSMAATSGPTTGLPCFEPRTLEMTQKKGSPSCYIWGTCQLFWPKSAVVYCSNLVCDCLKIRDHKINGSSVRAIPLTLVFFKWIRTSPASTWSKKFQSKRSCKWKT